MNFRGYFSITVVFALPYEVYGISMSHVVVCCIV